MEKVAIGSKIPEFILPDEEGKRNNINDFIGKNNLVIYFYPKDETPGCIKEACYFRDRYEQFRDNGALVIGISTQSPESHRKFKEKYKLPFTLLSDREHKVHRMFGVNKSPFYLPGRITFVVDKTGTIVYSFDSLTDISMHIDEAFRMIKKLNKSESADMQKNQEVKLSE